MSVLCTVRHVLLTAVYICMCIMSCTCSYDCYAATHYLDHNTLPDPDLVLATVNVNEPVRTAEDSKVRFAVKQSMDAI